MLTSFAQPDRKPTLPTQRSMSSNFQRICTDQCVHCAEEEEEAEWLKMCEINYKRISLQSKWFPQTFSSLLVFFAIVLLSKDKTIDTWNGLWVKLQFFTKQQEEEAAEEEESFKRKIDEQYEPPHNLKITVRIYAIHQLWLLTFTAARMKTRERARENGKLRFIVTRKKWWR